MLQVFIFILAIVAISSITDSSVHAELTSDYVHLIGLGSYKCMDVHGESLDNDAVVIIWDCSSNKKNQQWAIVGEPQEHWWVNNDKYYNLKVEHSGKCLTVKNAETDNESAIIQHECVQGGQAIQLWRFEQVSDGFYNIIGKASNKCLTVHGLGVDNGSHLVLYDCNGKPNQKWIPQS